MHSRVEMCLHAVATRFFLMKSVQVENVLNVLFNIALQNSLASSSYNKADKTIGLYCFLDRVV